MKGTGYELIARVGKTRGLEGKVTVHPAAGLPFCLREGLHVHVVPPALYGPRQLDISELTEHADGTVVVAFAQVTDIDAASELTGRRLLAAQDDLDFGDEDPSWQLLGIEVIDERYGALGEVTELIETPANAVLVIEGPYGEVLVPVIDQVIVEVPERDGAPLVTHVMDGLIDQEPDGLPLQSAQRRRSCLETCSQAD